MPASAISIRDYPVCFLLTFGHCGIDYLHSLFDSHSQLLLMPAFSYYRSWKTVGGDSIKTAGAMVDAWRRYIEHHPGMQVERRKLFYDDSQPPKFYWKLKQALEAGGLRRRDVFWAIHEAYAYATDVDVSRLKMVMVQEHLSFPFKDILRDFPDTRILHIVRDPRAAMAGSFRQQAKGRGYLLDFDFNLITEVWLSSISMWNYCRRTIADRYRTVRNEDLHSRLEGTMAELAQWLRIDYCASLQTTTFSGREWVGESAWMTADHRYPEGYATFYAPENIRRRWMQELSPREIVMAEFLTREIMRGFGYARLTPDNILRRLYGFAAFLWPNRRLVQHWRRTYPDIADFETIARKLDGTVYRTLWRYTPRPLKLAALAGYSVVTRLRNYFASHNRGSRYA